MGNGAGENMRETMGTREHGENVGASMISKSQEETEVSWRLEEKALEAEMRWLS